MYWPEMRAHMFLVHGKLFWAGRCVMVAKGDRRMQLVFGSHDRKTAAMIDERLCHLADGTVVQTEVEKLISDLPFIRFVFDENRGGWNREVSS